MAVIVEFVGLPASGKSTLAAHLLGLMEGLDLPVAENQAARGRLRKAWNKLLTFFFYRKALAVALLAMFLDRRPLDRRALALRWVLSTFERYLDSNLEGLSRSVVVVSEGVLQRALLLFFEPGRPAKLRLLWRYLAAMPRPDIVVYLHVSPSRAAGRHAGRSLPRAPTERFQIPHSDLTEVMEEARGFLEAAVMQAVETRGLCVVHFDADGPTPDRAALEAELLPLIIQRLAPGEEAEVLREPCRGPK